MSHNERPQRNFFSYFEFCDIIAGQYRNHSPVRTCFCIRLRMFLRFPLQSVWTARCEQIARDVGQTVVNLSRHTLHLVTREFGKQNVNTALPSPLTPGPHTPKPSSQPFKLLFNFVDCAVNFVDCPVIWTFIRISALQSVWSASVARTKLALNRTFNAVKSMTSWIWPLLPPWSQGITRQDAFVIRLGT